MMRALKITSITVAAVVLLILGGVAALLAFMDDDDYRRLAAYLVERATGRTMIVDGRFAVHPSLRPSLVMSEVRVLNPPWAAGPNLAQIGHMEIAIALRPLLSGTLVVERLILNDATFALERSADGQANWAIQADEGGQGMLDRFVPIFGTVRLRDVSLHYRDDGTGHETSVQLAHLTLEEDGAGARLDAQGAWDRQGLSAKGTLGTLAEALEPTKPFPLDVSVALAGLDLGVRGTIAEPAMGQGLDLQLRGHADDVAPFLHLFDPDASLAGKFEGEARLDGNLDAMGLGDLRLSLGQGAGDREPELQVTGKIATVRPDGATVLEGIDLQVEGAIPTAVMSRWLDRPLPHLGDVQGELTLGGTSKVLNVSAIKLQAGEGQALTMNVTGEVEQIRPTSDWSVQGADLQLDASAEDPSALEPLLNVSLPKLGALSYAGRLSGETGKWQLSGTAHLGETAIEQTFNGALEGTPLSWSGELAVTVAGLAVNARGAIGDVTTGQGLDLKVTGQTDNLAEFLALLGHRASATGRLTGEAMLTGTFEALNVADLSVILDSASGSSRQPALRATGTIAKVRPGSTPLLDGIALRVQGATSTAVLSGWLGRPLPDLGPVEGEFTLTGTSEVARLTVITLRAGPDDGLTITAEGSMTAIRPSRAVALRDVDLRLDAKAPEPSVIGTLLNTSLPPLGALAYAGRLSGGADKWALTGKVHVGGTVVDEDLVASFDGPRPRFGGRLFTAVLHLADFAVASNAAPSAGTDSIDLALAHASLDAIGAFDLDLIVDIDRIEGTELAIGGGEVDLTLKDRVLRIDPARFDLSAGTVLAHATADARAQPPRLDLSLHADDVQLGQFVTAMGRSTPITGELALILKLEGRGSSTEALLSSLGGDASFAIQRGDVDLSVNLATADLVTWLLAGARQGTNLVRRGRTDGRTKLKCLIGRFELERGIATAQSLVMVTPLTSSTATGSLDLVDQTIDLAVHLRARRGGLFDPPSVYRIQGPMADPTVDFSRTGFLARTIAGVVMKPIDALGALLPLVADGGRDPNNPCLQ